MSASSILTPFLQAAPRFGQYRQVSVPVQSRPQVDQVIGYRRPGTCTELHDVAVFKNQLHLPWRQSLFLRVIKFRVAVLA